jgi:hypothetical protein
MTAFWFDWYVKSGSSFGEACDHTRPEMIKTSQHTRLSLGLFAIAIEDETHRATRCV